MHVVRGAAAQAGPSTVLLRMQAALAQLLAQLTKPHSAGTQSIIQTPGVDLVFQAFSQALHYTFVVYCVL